MFQFNSATNKVRHILIKHEKDRIFKKIRTFFKKERRNFYLLNKIIFSQLVIIFKINPYISIFKYYNHIIHYNC